VAQPSRCATGQKCPPAPTTIGASIASLAIQRPCAEPQARARAREQIVVELAAADPVRDRLAVVDARGPRAEACDGEAVHRLEHALARILRGIDLERRQHRRRDPARAHLVAREAAPVEHHHVEARAHQRARARRAARPAAHHEHVAALPRHHGLV
jgi:hypothetical protein